MLAEERNLAVAARDDEIRDLDRATGGQVVGIRKA
jgi:hypothetical protein